ncbi:hypothetical protein Tco_0418113 [Tanacetum coccineum]
MTSMCCDDAYRVTSRDSALARCDIMWLMYKLQRDRNNAEMEEENAKLWLFLKEFTEYLVKEEGVADIETKKLSQLEDISTTALENNLMQSNTVASSPAKGHIDGIFNRLNRSLRGSLQMDEDDEISNLVDLHMYMLCDGLK